MAATMEITLSWDVTPYSVVSGYQCFWRTAARKMVQEKQKWTGPWVNQEEYEEQRKEVLSD